MNLSIAYPAYSKNVSSVDRSLFSIALDAPLRRRERKKGSFTHIISTGHQSRTPNQWGEAHSSKIVHSEACQYNFPIKPFLLLKPLHFSPPTYTHGDPHHTRSQSPRPEVTLQRTTSITPGGMEVSRTALNAARPTVATGKGGTKAAPTIGILDN